MKRIIKNLVYDTATARFVGEHTQGSPGVTSVVTERMYCKKTGEYFLHISITGETYTHQELVPIPYVMAREWISQTQSDTVFENEFGAPQDLDGSSSAGVTAPAKVLYALRKEARDKGMSLSALISSILEEYVSHRE